jgi:hypothetical protein
MNINPLNQCLTQGVVATIQDKYNLFLKVIEQFKKESDICLDGGTDKEFFTLTYENTKLFIAVNEISGLTVMLPEEY